MTGDDEFAFEPKPGRINARNGRARSNYLRQIEQTIARSGGRKRLGSPSRRSVFHGNRIGRGAGVGRVLASRAGHAAFRQRRVVIKTRLIKMAGRGIAGPRVHLRYLQREGVTREGLPGNLYEAKLDRVDGAAFLERSDGDRHQFRFIVSPEDATEYEDLKGVTRRLMARMEADLSTRLDWVAVDHYNTGHPHTHVVLRGRDDRGKDLIIAREYLSQGMRERAAEIVSLDLGPRTDQEIESRLGAEVEQDRFTSIDRGLLREADEPGGIRSGADSDAFNQTLRAGRLQKLRRLGLAEEVAPGRWQLADDLEPVLRRMGERGDIIKTLHRALAREGLARAAIDHRIYDPTDANAGRLVGRVVARGLSDEINDRHYLIVDGIDGRTHYVEIGKADAIDPAREGAIVAIGPRLAEPRAVDRTVAEVAAANGGRYDVTIHQTHDPRVSDDFAQAHVRRLEAMRRAGAGIEREPDGQWIIGPDHLERAAGYERMLARASPVVMQTLSDLPLERQVGTMGATWLDRELVSETPSAIREAGFGREVRDALVRRQQWLIEQDLARVEQDQVSYGANLLRVLRRRELTQVGAQLSRELGLPYAEAYPGERIEGVYKRRVDLASGRFALIEKSYEFTLVPWRPDLDRHLDRAVSGIPRGNTFSWSLGPKRGLSL
jgi:type IV secretory pathway VirD2 relaxase